MTRHYDLNSIVKHYKVSSRAPERELKDLKRRLSDVPVSLSGLGAALKDINCDYDDLWTRAELHDPQMRLFLLSECVDQHDEDYLSGRIITPYPRLLINPEMVSKTFLTDHAHRMGEMISAWPGHKTARVISRPEANYAIVMYERGRGKRNLEYLELIMTHYML